MFTIFTLDDCKKWDEVVKSFKEHDIYYFSGYTKAFQIHGDGEPIMFYYENGKFRAMNVVFKRDIGEDKNFLGRIPRNTFFDIRTSYGYGGFLIEGEMPEDDWHQFDDEYKSACREMGLVCEFVRFHPVLKNVEKIGAIYDVTTLGPTITMKLQSQVQIWESLSNKNRNVIRKAQKSGVQIFWGRDPALIDRFITLYNETMDNDNAEEYYYFLKDFYYSILSDLKYNSLIFYAEYEGKLIAMAIILFTNQQMHYHLSASDRKYQHVAPNNLLLYEAACWGCENGYKTFHLGGGLGGKEDSLFSFKKAFNKKSDTMFAIGKKIFDQEKYNELVEIARVNGFLNIDESYFPRYRS